MTTPAPDPRLVTLLAEALRDARNPNDIPTATESRHAQILAPEVEAHVQERIAEALDDLQGRLARAAGSLIELRNAASGGESERIGGKLQGVRLARSYVEEAIRAAAHRPEGGSDE